MLKINPILLFLFFLLIRATISAQFDYNGMKTLNINRNKSMDPYFIGITNSVTPVMCALPIASYTAWIIKKDKKYLQNTVIQLESMAINGVLTLTLKELVRRPRPFITYSDVEKVVPAGSMSFPSGHTSTAFNTATALTLTCPKWYLIVPAYTWASLAGYSRIHLGVHYPSDVLAGAFIGSASAIAGHYLNNWIYNKKFDKSTSKKL